MIIAASAGCGKTTLAQKYPDKVIDFESSAYCYLLHGKTRADIEAAKGTKRERNPEFPLNYINAIKDAVGKYDVICVWCHHDKIFPYYRKYNVPFVICYPDHGAVSAYRERFENRGNTKDWIDHVMDTYDEYIDIWTGLPEEKIILRKDETLEQRLKEMNIL